MSRARRFLSRASQTPSIVEQTLPGETSDDHALSEQELAAASGAGIYRFSHSVHQHLSDAGYDGDRGS